MPGPQPTPSMKRKTFWQSLSIFILCFRATLPALADGEDPRVEISADRLAPGMILEVRGVNLSREEQIPIALVGVKGEFQLGVITSNEVGEFTQTFTLPNDLPEGTYRVLARNTSQLAVISAPLTIQGPAVMSDVEEGGLRDEDEPLLAPMPTAVKVSAAEQTNQAASESWLNPAMIAIALGVLVLGTFSFILVHRSRQPASQKE